MSRVAKRLASLCRGMRMPLCLTPEEAAGALGVRRERMDWLVSSGRVRSVLYKGRRYVTSVEIERQRSSSTS